MTMNKMRVKCIRCGKEWEKLCAVKREFDDCSGSLCNACFVTVATPTIRRKQIKEGNFDCFGKADHFCDQFECKFRQWCLNMHAGEEVG